jgi:excisionase family DNA binding protein
MTEQVTEVTTAAAPSEFDTLDLEEAAAYLKLEPRTLMGKVQRHEIPGAKVGRAWLFLRGDLADYIRSLYNGAALSLLIDRKEGASCQLGRQVRAESGKLVSPSQAAEDLNSQLERLTRRRRKNSTTSGDTSRGSRPS